jgi:hypothetical protein
LANVCRDGGDLLVHWSALQIQRMLRYYG